MIRPVLAVAGLAAIAGCHQAPGDGDSRVTQIQDEATVIQPRATPMAAATPSGAPPSERNYVGRWAASDDLCATGAWRFAADALKTAGEVSCTFNQVAATATGYRINAICAAEGRAMPQTIDLRFAQPSRTLQIDSPMWHDQKLVYCGPLAP